MKTLKVLIASLSILTFIFAISVAGCKKDTSTTTNNHTIAVCDTLACHNGGTCTNGACVCGAHFAGTHCDSCQSGFRGSLCDSCFPGYEGTNCNVLSSAKFVGSYAGSDTCSGSTYPDNWIINTGPTLTQLQVSVAGVTLIVNFSGNTFTIPAQSAGGLTFNSGTGTLNGNNLTVTYNYTNSSSTQTCKFGGTK